MVKKRSSFKPLFQTSGTPRAPLLHISDAPLVQLCPSLIQVSGLNLNQVVKSLRLVQSCRLNQTLKSIISFSATLVLLLSTLSTAVAGPLPDTGQTKCYDNSGEIACPVEGQPFYGQDGNYSINPPSYTKLDASGNALPDDAVAWAMVKDNVTGLIWENKTNDGTIHDGNKTFTWCDRNPATNGGNQGTCGTGTGEAATDTEAFIKALNDAQFGGFADWRMPTLKELTTIVDRSRSRPAINASLFPNTVLSDYWSSTGASVNFDVYDDGGTGGGNTFDSFAVRAVRGGQSIGGYSINGDGTVTDTATGLMWQQESVSGKTWEAALSYAEGLDLAGYPDWRLPNITELQSLVDYSRYNPSIDTQAFSGPVSSGYWPDYCSSTTYAYNYDEAWCVDFDGGHVSHYHDKSSIYGACAVRAVRGGQSRLLGHLVISAPAQAARWEIGTQQTVTWDTAGIAGNVKITLSRQGGKPGTFTEVIAENAPNTGSYNWTVTGPESFNCALRIEPLADPSKGTTQSLFTIATLQNAWITAAKQGDPGHYKITLDRRYTDGTIPLEATFTVSDNAVATVDQSGLLTALKNGYVEVSTTYEVKTYKKGLFVYTTLEAGESEPNSDKSQADSLMLAGKSFYQGTLPADDVDYFKFTLTSPSYVNVGYLSKSSTADVKIELFNNADVLMASAVSQNGEQVILPVGLPAGDYFMKLSPSGDLDQTGNYIVTYKIMDALLAEAVTPLGMGEAKTGTVNSLADQTDFSFTLPTEQAVQLTFTPTSSLAKYHLAILDGNQTVIDQLDCLDQRPVRLEAIYAAGSYTLRVTPVGVVDALNPFSIALAANSGQLEKEPNDAAAQATAFDISQSITGRLSSNSDTDYYTFSLDRPRFLELNFASPGSTGDFTLTLFKESDANEIDGIDVLGGKTTSLHMGLGIGRYFLLVKGKGANIDTIHNYTLTFTDSTQTDLEIESNNTLRVANAIGKAQARRGRIYSATDKDYYGFNLPEADFLTVHFAPSSTTASYKVSLLDENDAVLGSPYTASGGIALDIADVFFDTPGNHYLRIESNGTIDQYKPYALSIASAANITGLKQLVNVSVTGSKPTMTIGDTQTLTAAAGYSDATATAISAPLWTSLNPTIALVDAGGVVTAKAEGTTTIVAGFGGLTGKFDITVGAPVNVVKQHYGNLILVAGGGIAATNTLKDSTQYLADLVYRRFKARLFADEDIYYLNPATEHDLDGDGYFDRIVDDSSPTVAEFGSAVTQWAKDQSTDGPLYIYLIDHGGIDNFMIFPDEIVTADQLKGWLDAFQTATGRKIVVLIEACKSGSFTDNLVASGQDRIVVTSADNQDSYIQLAGRISFSQFFVDRLLTGDSLHQGYLKAKNQLAGMGLPYSSMRPQLAEGVSLSAVKTMIGGDFAIAGLLPDITEQSANMNIQANTTQNFYARLSSLEGIESVWAVVTPPDYTPPAVTGDLTAPQVTLPTFTLTDPDKDRTFEGSFNAFSLNGDYKITFYARNTNGNVSVSLPPQTVVTVTGGQGGSYSLTVAKSGAGSGTVTGSPGGIDCGSTCTVTYTEGSQVTLSATAAAGSTFTGWSGGGCTGTGSCTVTMDGIKAITATFADIPPAGGITINEGAEFTGSDGVTLNLSASDVSGIVQMQFSVNNTDWSEPEPFAATKTWSLAMGDGVKTVWVKFQDKQGSWSEAYSHSITLDTRPPVTTAAPPGGAFTTAQQVTLMADEPGTIYYTTDGSEPTESSFVYKSAITVGSSLTVKFFAKDRAGNKELAREAAYVIQPALSANAGGDQVVFDHVLLDGSGSQGDIVSYHWQLTHKKNPAGSRTASGRQATLTGLMPGIYDVTLTVTDSASQTATDQSLVAAAGIWDVNGDKKLGLAEVIYILQMDAGMR